MGWRRFPVTLTAGDRVIGRWWCLAVWLWPVCLVVLKHGRGWTVKIFLSTN